MAAPSACGEARPAAAAALIGWRLREAGRGGLRLCCRSAGRGGQCRAAIAPRFGATVAASGGSRRKDRGRGVRWRGGKAARAEGGVSGACEGSGC